MATELLELSGKWKQGETRDNLKVSGHFTAIQIMILVYNFARNFAYCRVD
jgi:hypothetical protein